MERKSSERSRWRDEWISDWHHRQHASLAMTDIDFVCLEYRWRNPVAIIDYKRMRPMKLGPSASLQALNQLANIARLPFFLVFYDEPPPVFTVWPENQNARDIIGEQTVMSEREYIEFLFALGGQKPDAVWLDGRSDFKPIPLEKAS